MRLQRCSGFQAGGCLFVALIITGGAFAQEQPGVPARSKPDDYATHVNTRERVYAASVLSKEQVKHLFAFDISKYYTVVEIACYPREGSFNLDPDSFVVKAGKDKDVVRHADAMTVAANIQQKNTPRPPSETTPVYTQGHVGYETGTDPYTGRRVHDVYGGAGVGVGGPPEPQFPAPGGWPQDRELLERQLAEHSLPGGRFAHPVAGYLYFPSALLKKAKGVYELKDLDDTSGAADLEISPKSH